MTALVDRVVVVGWDGLRPDMVSDEVTPNLRRLIAGGARYRRSTAAFPSETRPNNATIGTGCYPGRHGITANRMHAPDLGLPELNTGRPDHLLRIGERHGRIVPPVTLGEALTAAGRRIAVVGSGSPGQTLLQNPHGAGWTINRALRVPAALDAELERRFGPVPAGPLAQIDVHLQRIAIEHVLPALDPHLLVLWSGQPDSSLHRFGLGSPEVQAALRANDARLGELLERLDLAGTAVLFVSDHGHTTVRDRIDLAGELVASGLAGPDELAIVQAIGYHLRGAARERLPEIVAWLRRRPWCGPIFVRDDRWDNRLEGAAPASVLWDGAPGRWVPDIQLSLAWDDAPNERGVPGHAYGLEVEGGKAVVTDHGSLSPRDMGNLIVLAGAGVRRGVELDVPAGTVDVAPTVLHLLGVAPPETTQGRSLREALDGGAAPPVTTGTLLEGAWGRLVRRLVDGTAYVAVES
ncbi:MAG TPA: alkaline phosphatase family protein [Chloroflexota bacterium]|jgi:arylsulfatase A-like enzyme|nr:alkaline phosphatase family protein [Chloroflexota bacterium]